MKRRSWTIGQQIIAAFGFALLMLVAVGILAYRTTDELIHTGEQVAHTHAVLTDIEEISSTLVDAETGQRGFVITGQEAFLQPYRDAIQRVEKDYDAARRLTADHPGQQQRLDRLRPLIRSKLDELNETIDLRRRQGFEPTQKVINEGSGKQAMEDIRAILAEMRAEENGLLEQRTRDAQAAAQKQSTTLAVGISGTVLVVLVVAYLIVRRLDQQIGSAIHHMQSSSVELQTAATQQVRGAKEQTTVTAEVSMTVQELLSTSRQIAESAQRVAHIADETTTAAAGGDRAVSKAQESIGTIRRQVDLIVNHMLDLGKRSQEIGSILDIINELAEQTNILAINATIEAAGAGESGRRFSVVADEIRKLADRVGGSTREIRSLIEDIRASANTTVMVTEDGSKAVEAGTRQVGEVATNFQRIAELVRATADASREIELSTKQQSTAVEQLNTAMNDVAQTARETEKSSAETMQTSAQLVSLSQQLSLLIQRVASA